MLRLLTRLILLFALGFFAPGEAAARVVTCAGLPDVSPGKTRVVGECPELAVLRQAAAMQAAETQWGSASHSYEVASIYSLAAESRLVTSGGAADAFQYSQLKAALRLEQSMGNGKFVTNAALELGETRIAVFDQASGKMFIGRPGAMGHIDVVAEHGLTAGDSLIGGAIRVTEGGQMQFLPVSGSFPLPAANATGALNAVRGTGVSIIGGPK